MYRGSVSGTPSMIYSKAFYDISGLKAALNCITPMAKFMNLHIQELNRLFDANYPIRRIVLPNPFEPEVLYNLDRRDIVVPTMSAMPSLSDEELTIFNLIKLYGAIDRDNVKGTWRLYQNSQQSFTIDEVIKSLEKKGLITKM